MHTREERLQKHWVKESSVYTYTKGDNITRKELLNVTHKE